jgi:NAD(P)-dependent dehydrogenase (short-subunit alcohol dehydrogenase family)
MSATQAPLAGRHAIVTGAGRGIGVAINGQSISVSGGEVM